MLQIVLISPVEGLYKLERYTSPTEHARAICASWEPGIDHSVCWRQRNGWTMVIGNDDVDVQLAGVDDLLNVGTGAVGGDDEVGAARLEHIERGQVQSAAIAQAMGNMIVQWHVRMLDSAKSAEKQG